jgi:tight adherence protein B
MNGLPPLLLIGAGVFAALAVGVLWGLSALTRQDKRTARVAAVTAPHLPAAPPPRPRVQRALLERQPFQGIAALFGLRADRAAEYKVKWWVVLLGALVVARGAAGLLAVVLGDWVVFATPALWLVLGRAAFSWLDTQRRQALFRQLPDALGMMVRMVRVGIPVTEAVRVIARESAKPTSEEFQRISDRLAIAMPLDQALAETALRNGVAEYRFFSTALSLQAQTGGGLSETLDNLAEVIRKRVALQQRGIALAAEARTSALILIALPFLTGALLAVLNPPYVAMLFRDAGGQRILAVAIGMLLLGIFSMRTLIQRVLR